MIQNRNQKARTWLTTIPVLESISILSAADINIEDVKERWSKVEWESVHATWINARRPQGDFYNSFAKVAFIMWMDYPHPDDAMAATINVIREEFWKFFPEVRAVV